MYSTAQIQQFRSGFVSKWTDSCCDEIRAKQHHLLAEFRACWEKFFMEISTMNKAHSYIEISLMRRALLMENTPAFKFESFGDDWFFVRPTHCTECLVQTFSDIFDKRKKSFFDEAQLYAGSIPKPVAGKVLLETISMLEKAIADVLIDNVSDWLIVPEESRGNICHCSFGEFRRFQYVILQVN